MAEQTDNNPKAIERIARLLRNILQQLVFSPDLSADFRDEDRIFSKNKGYFVCDEKHTDKLIEQLEHRFSNIARKTIENLCTRALSDLLDSFVEQQERDWTTSFALSELGAELPTDDQLESVAEKLLNDLSAIMRDYTIFVPLMGVDLAIPNYDFGPVKIVRTKDSLPILEKEQNSAEFKYIHPEIMSLFESTPCLVESHISGDTDFARQEGLRLANQLAAILNLHLARWSSSDHLHQRIQCVGVPTLSTRVILARTNLLDDSGTEKPTYLHATSTHSILKHSLSATELNAIKQQGFDKIWKCFGESNELYKRIERSVSWYDKAANFYEADAQFVGFTTALEILLVSSSSLSDPHSTWSGITQQLADRCAFLLGHDLQSTMDMAAHVKKLYRVRSKIVHTGKEPTQEELSDMRDLVSRAILDFAQRDFQSFDQFETWIKRIQYSCNLSEIESLFHP